MLTRMAAVWRRWRVRLSVSILDQGTFSGANFVLNVLAARWLPPASYGAFAVAYAAVVLIGGPHGALLVDPLNVVGARRFKGQDRPYLRAVATLHMMLMVPLGILIAGSARWSGAVFALPPEWLVAFGFAVPLVLLLWLLRSACYVAMRPNLALTASAVYAVGLLSLLTWAHAGSWLTAPSALVLMGVASAIASLWVALPLGLFSPPRTLPGLAVVAREHWSYGRWILGASAAHGVASGLYTPLVGALAGLEQAAVLRALQNLVVPLQQILAGVAMVAYPFMSRQVAEHGVRYLKRRGAAFVLVTAGAAAVYGVAITALGRPLLAAAYRTPYYTSYASLVPLFAVGALMTALAQCLSILVRVMNRPQAVLWSKLAAAAWPAGVGIFLVWTLGVRGAVLSLAGGALVEAAVLALGMRQGLSRDELALSASRVEDVL